MVVVFARWCKFCQRSRARLRRCYAYPHSHTYANPVACPYGYSNARYSSGLNANYGTYRRGCFVQQS